MAIKKRKRITSQEQKDLRKFHNHSNRHVLVLEADLEEKTKREIFHLAEQCRICGNHIKSIMNRRLVQIQRTKKYRALQTVYKRLMEKGLDKDSPEVKRVTAEMEKLQNKYQVTKKSCEKLAEGLKERYDIPAVMALSLSHDIWSSVRSVLHGKGKQLRYRKVGDLPVISATQIKSGIILKNDGNDISFWFNGNAFSYIHNQKDLFITEEIQAILYYMKNSKEIDSLATQKYLESGKLTDTFRPCFCSFVCKTIRGRLRVYVHIMIEGNPLPKKRSDGSPRHIFGKGVIGCDIGTQTIAWTSDFESGIKNLAERGSSILKNEKKEKRLLRAMERSRRAMNPENYNPDGTIRKGPKTWKNSKRYIRLRNQYRDFCRKNVENRHLAIRRDINLLRAEGDIFITEPKNAKKLQKRASGPAERQEKESVIIQKDGTTKTIHKFKRKKRFGKSIQNRCPGYFQAQAEKKFPIYIEVPNTYRASQFDHTNGEYKKHKLSERMFELSDGTKVQRDWYSSFLLYCCDTDSLEIDKIRCQERFDYPYQSIQLLIQYFQDEGIHILNSGI